MRSSKRIIVKLFLPLILAVSLVIGGYSWADARSHSVSAKALANAPSPTEILEGIATPQLVRRQRTRRKPVKSQQDEINYESIAQDILLMISWLESPDATPTWFASKLRDYDCLNLCTMEIRNDRNYSTLSASNHSFIALKNEKSVYRVEVLSQKGSSGIKAVSIFLNFNEKPFSIAQIGKVLPNKNIRRISDKYPSCDAGPCYISSRRYLVERNHLSSVKKYDLYLDMGADTKKQLEYLRRISFEPPIDRS
jgi:hypothetical protein